ncbi:zinc finger MYM-type protein 4 isoform X5 [Anguilla rostrata]|uniref:zinc finger MYM-type protein 4 isoform X5 n=1 Tax=Anguilla rostrata TaxID=7938 RepID=UPI0030D06603
MPRSKDIPHEMRKKVIEIYQSDKSYRVISEAVGVHRSTVRAIIAKWKILGTVVNRPRSGRPAKISPGAQRQLIQEVTKDPRRTSNELQASLASPKLVAETLDTPAGPTQEVSDVEMQTDDSEEDLKPMVLNPALSSKASNKTGVAIGEGEVESKDIAGRILEPLVGDAGAGREKDSREEKDSRAEEDSRPTETEKDSRPTETEEDIAATPLGRGSRPTETEKDSRPTETEKDSRPTETEKDSRPTETEKDSRPTETEKDSRPTETEKDSRPTETEKDSRPTETEKDSRPTETEKDSRPTEAEEDSRPTEAMDSASLPVTASLAMLPSVPSSSKEMGGAAVKRATEPKERLGAGEESEQVPMVQVTEEECQMDTLPSMSLDNSSTEIHVEKDTNVQTAAGKDAQAKSQDMQINQQMDGKKDQVSGEDTALRTREAEEHSLDRVEACGVSTGSIRIDVAGPSLDRQPPSSPLPTTLPIHNRTKPQETETEARGKPVDEPCQEVEMRDSQTVSDSPPVKIKDEPVDEEYDHALVPQSTPGGIKDEPDTTEEFGLQHKTPEELKISAVFSVGGNAAPGVPVSIAQPVKEAAPPKMVSLTTPPAPNPAPNLAPNLAPAPPLTSVRVSCSGCKKVLLKGQTAYQRKGSSQLFCSTICLTSYTLPTIKSVLKKTCHYCLKDIENPKDVIIAPVDMAGTVKDFCSQSCLSSFDFKRKTAVSTLSSEGVTIKCSVCNNMAVIRHEVNYQGTVHKLCSDSCFTRFRFSNNLTMNCCENCGGYCYSGNGHCHVLQIEGANKKLCSPSCVTAYKMKSVKVTPCAICRTLRSSAEMVEHVTSYGKTELFCNSSCVTAHKVQSASTSGTVLPCNQCKVSAVPQYHLAMSDGSMRNFCSYGCVINFQTAFNKASTQSPLSVVPSSVLATTTTLPQPVVTSAATSDSAPPAPAPSQPVVRGQIRLSCKHCYRLFASKPELFEFKGQMVQFCGKTCSEEFKKVNIVMARCEYCKIDKVVKEVKKINKLDCSFCSEGCKLLYKHDLAKRWGNHCRTCAYCSNTSQRVIQSQFGSKLEEFCSDECMSHHTVLFLQMSKCDACKRQGKLIESLKWLGEMKHFCNLHCLLQFCSQQGTGTPRARATPVATAPQGTATQAPVAIAPALPPTASLEIPAPSNLASKEATPVIANVVSLASAPTGQPMVYANTALQGAVPVTPAKVIEHASTQTDALKLPPAPPVRVLKNKALLCKPMSQNKGTICKPHTQSTETQTDENFPRVIVLPVPVPVFIPVPLHMYTQYTPSALGLPVPVPVPMFLPTTLDSAERIVETIQEIKNKIPSNPYEADLILMADLLAEEDEEKEKPLSHGDQGSSYSGDLESEAVSTPHSWEDELATTAHKHGRAPDQDGAPTPATPSPPSQLDLEADFPFESSDHSTAPAEDSEASPLKPRVRRRARDGFPPRKRGRKRSSPAAATAAAAAAAGQPRDAPPPAGGLRLHHQYGVNAWKTWVQWRSTQPDVEKPRFGARPMVLKEDLLQCSTAELSYGLCRFIGEVRRPNGEPYTPDSIFYLCLGIQQHLFENGRLENIFTDLFYGKFTAEITRLLKDWKPTVLPSGYLCSRVEEEYLWECKQLGAYSPIVLLNTLLFFSAKLFRMKTVALQRRLSFAHVMRCTKTRKNNRKTSFLRFYPPAPKEPTNAAEKAVVPAKRKKEDEPEDEVLEMPENTENPLRCPVRLYEFYLSKCSDSVKQRTDLFYLQPERSCVPNSPLWYSSVPLEDSTMETMLTRILTVREVHLEVEPSQKSASDAETSE